MQFYTFWLAIQNRLSTKDKLLKYLDIPSGICDLCEETKETVQHLFFRCRFSDHCLVVIKNWLGWKMKKEEVPRIVRWLQRAWSTQFQKRSLAAVIAVLIYWNLHCRNRRLWNQDRLSKEEIVDHHVKKGIKNRMIGIGCTVKETNSFNWFMTL